MAPAVIAAIIAAAGMMGSSAMNKMGGSGIQSPQTPSPSLGQTMQKPLGIQDVYPKPQQQNGSLLGNSLYSNPYMTQRMRGGY